MHRNARLGVGASLLGLLGAACQPDPGPVPQLDALRQPTGLAVSTGQPALFVTNGNWDREQTDSTLMVVDLVTLYEQLARPGDAGDRSRPCRRVSADDSTIECDPAQFIDPRVTVRLATGAGNIAVDQPTGAQGPMRLLVPTRRPASITWLDVLAGDETPILDCDQNDEGLCGERHEIRSGARSPDRLPGEPSRVFVDDQGARFAYVPHLLGGGLSMLALDGAAGPELADVEDEFYREDPFEDEELLGGFAVAAKACDPERPVSGSRECSRPYLYTTQRYFPGIRHFTVAPGLDLILPGREISITAVNPQVVLGRPFMADLAFEDPAVGDRLLIVQATPPALVRLDTTLDEDDEPVDGVLGVVPLCDNPNVLAVYRPEGAEALALVTCAGEGRLAVVGLGAFRALASVPVGRGAHEVVVDHERHQAYVSNPAEDTISIVSLDRRSPQRFTEWARLGLGAGSREGS